MKRACFSILLFAILFNASAQKKDKDVLTGTWYAKLPAYKFQQDGTAVIYTKAVVNNHTQKMIIEKDSSYTYFELNGKDTIFVNGKISISSDTLIFLLDSTNHPKYKYYTKLKFYLYQLNKAQLVYSFSPFPTTILPKGQKESVFQPVETNAYYKDGEHQLLKSIYSYLESGKPANTDSVYLNSYSLTINDDGSFNIATLFEMNGKPQYQPVIKKALSKLPAPFIAATQNGKNVRGRMTFKVTY